MASQLRRQIDIKRDIEAGQQPIIEVAPTTTLSLRLHRLAVCEPQSLRSDEGSLPLADGKIHAAANTTLSTTELLEQALSYLDVQGPIILRRVSRKWRDVLNGSLILQRVMFLAPEPELNIEWHLKAYSRGKPHLYGRQRRGTAPIHDETVMKWSRFNPLMFKRGPVSERRTHELALRFIRLDPSSTFINAGADGLIGEMLIAQPLVTHARVGCRTRLINEKGIKVRDVRLAMQQQRTLQNHEPEEGYYLPRHEDYAAHHFSSFVIEDTMFTSKEEEKLENIIRPVGNTPEYCTERFRSHILVAVSESSDQPTEVSETGGKLLYGNFDIDSETESTG